MEKNMENPVVQIQKRIGAANRVEFAKKTGIGYATLYALQNGCPASMSMKTAERLSLHAQKSPSELQHAYRKWRKQQQE